MDEKGAKQFTVAELIERLASLPPDAPVEIVDAAKSAVADGRCCQRSMLSRRRGSSPNYRWRCEVFPNSSGWW